MKTQDITLVTKLLAVLNEHEQAKLATPEDNPFHERDLKDMTNNAGLLKSADKHPARNVAPESALGYEMEAARFTGLQEEKADKSAKRMAAHRARAARKVAFDEIANKPVIPSKDRMQEAWFVVFPLVTIVTKIALSKQRWSARFLGSVADDIPQIALEKMALVLAKSDKDLEPLRQAAEELGGMAKRSNQIPGDQRDESEDPDLRKQRRQAARNRKWLMGMANNRVMGALVDTYTERHNLRWDNLDLIATVMANISGVGDDPMTARFKADRAPAFMGTRFQRPGGMDANVMATAINAAITELGLDPIVEIILNDENRRVDGAIKWAHCAEQLFMAAPGGRGPWMWDLVVKATEHHKKPRRARADAARTFVRNQFEWLPFLIASVVEASEIKPIGFSAQPEQTSQLEVRKIMASDLELFYLGEAPAPREMLRPALTYASRQEAAQILAETIGFLVTGEDVVNSVVWA